MQGFPVKRQALSVPVVTAVYQPRYPPTILWAVVSIRINPVKLHAFRTVSHVGVKSPERTEAKPAIAN